MGYEGERAVATPGGERRVAVSLAPNPSHLEFVGAVINGTARAHQRADGRPGERDPKRVLPIAVHGDAAFIGEGVVAEALNMYRLRGYTVGGTLHLIVNNQVGFTTDPVDSRSTHYASDLAKGFDVPVVHVNGDDAEACLIAVRVAIAYREAFAKDVLIDLVGYRRWGHNETDEPAFTQPRLYDAIKAHPTPRQVWGKRLVDEGLLSADDVEAVDREVRAAFQAAHERVKRQDAAHAHDSPEGRAGRAAGAGRHRGAGRAADALQRRAAALPGGASRRTPRWPRSSPAAPRRSATRAGSSGGRRSSSPSRRS
jgi:2-oxoglutarate dehydrogenase E1 component